MNMTTTARTKLTPGISHVGLAMSNLESSLQFFEAIGYAKIGGDESYPSYFLSDGHSMITLWQTEQDFISFNRRNNVGLHHLAIKIPTLEVLSQIYETIVAMDGVKSDFAPNELKGTPLTHAMVFEPSGNRIEFTHHAA
jgi:lactoylglutathione lyase